MNLKDHQAKYLKESEDWIAVDVDYTITDRKNCYPEFGKVRPGMIEQLQRLQDAGKKILITTARVCEGWDNDKVEETGNVEDFLIKEGVPYDDIWWGWGTPHVNCRIDDRAWRFDNNMEYIVDSILEEGSEERGGEVAEIPTSTNDNRIMLEFLPTQSPLKVTIKCPKCNSQKIWIALHNNTIGRYGCMDCDYFLCIEPMPCEEQEIEAINDYNAHISGYIKCSQCGFHTLKSAESDPSSFEEGCRECRGKELVDYNNRILKEERDNRELQ